MLRNLSIKCFMPTIIYIILMYGIFANTSSAQSSITLKINTQSPGITIPNDFLGFSFGSATLKSYINGTFGYFFASYNIPGITLFNNLGIKNLRIGGGTEYWTSDGSLPQVNDIDTLFGFVKHVKDLKVIYSFPLFNANKTANASAAKYIWDKYSKYIDCFELDNEPDWHSAHTYPGHTVDPDIYETNPGVPGSAFPSYIAKWKEVAAAILDSVPEARFAGPSTGSNYPVAGGANTYYNGKSWTVNFAEDLMDSSYMKLITFHNYVGQSASGTPQEMIDKMLSTSWNNWNNSMIPIKIPYGWDSTYTNFQSLYYGTAVPLLQIGIPFRLEESNSFSGAIDGGSNCFATALFTLDYLHWWAAHGAAGVNFHNKEWILNATISKSQDGVYGVYPMGYGIKAFDIGGHGEVDSILITNNDDLNVTSYAVSDSTNLFITIINREHGDSARSAAINIDAIGLSNNASVMFLTAPSVASTTGVTLGGETISNSIPWQNVWTPLDSMDINNGRYFVTVPASSAAIVKISSKPTYVSNHGDLLKQFSLEQNYPNPFNPSTIISYTIPNNGFVTLKVYNILGQVVTTLLNRYETSGVHKVDFNASKLTSGVYVYSLQYNGIIQNKKMILLR